MSTPILCPKASVYYVPGLGGADPRCFQAPFRQIVESIFGLDFQPKHKEILVNKCKLALKDDTTLLNNIKSIAKHHDCCGLVSLVWFAHSHGAKMICEAYKQLQSTPVFDKIKKTSAIICIGGASLATDNLARVVFNVEFKNDKIARGASNLTNERQGKILQVGPLKNRSCLCCDKGSPEEPEFKEAKRTLSGFSLGVSVVSQGASNSGSSNSTGGTDEKAHYIEEYLECRNWKKKVQELLPLCNLCGTHSQ